MKWKEFLSIMQLWSNLKPQSCTFLVNGQILALENLMDQCEKDTNGNVSLGEVTAVDCKETLLHSVDSNIHLVGLGLDKLIAVATQDAVLVTNKGEQKMLS